MTEFDPGSYCGLYCGACEIVAAYKKELETGIKAKWEDLPAQLRNNINPAPLICRGCRTDSLYEGCRRCGIRACASDKKIEACIMCSEYPCHLVKERIQTVERFKDALPHCKVMFKNLDTLKEKGLNYWLEEQRKKWSCPGCGAPFTWYQEKCTKCGRELTSIKDHNNY
jgi:hypothetical protein